MAQSRSDKLKRLVAVQRHMEKMAEMDLAGTTRSRLENAEAMDEVMQAITSVDPVHQIFSSQYGLRYGRLSVRDGQLANLQDMQETRVLKERAKADRLDEHFREARSDEDRVAEDNSVFDLLEQMAAGQATASAKLPRG